MGDLPEDSERILYLANRFCTTITHNHARLTVDFLLASTFMTWPASMAKAPGDMLFWESYPTMPEHF